MLPPHIPPFVMMVMQGPESTTEHIGQFIIVIVQILDPHSFHCSIFGQDREMSAKGSMAGHIAQYLDKIERL